MALDISTPLPGAFSRAGCFHQSPPGLGIDFDEAKLAEVAPTGLYDFPRLRCADGSHTNW